MRSLEPSRAASTRQPRVLLPERGRAGAVARDLVFMRSTLTLKKTIPASRHADQHHPAAAAQQRGRAARCGLGSEAGAAAHAAQRAGPWQRPHASGRDRRRGRADWRGARSACVPGGPLLWPRRAASAAGLQLARDPQLAGRGARVVGDLALGGRTARPVISSASGSRPQTQIGKSGGQTQPRARSARNRLTRRSSSEWKEIAASRPPGRSSSQAAGSARSSEPSSSFTRDPDRLEHALGRDARRRTARAAGTADLIVVDQLVVVSSRRARRACARSRARSGRAKRSSPYCGRACASRALVPRRSRPRARRAPASGSIRMSSGAS